MKKLVALAFAVSMAGPFACATDPNEESIHQASLTLTLTKGGASPTGRYTGDYRVDFRGRWDEVDARVRETASTLERLSLVPGEKLVVAGLSDGISTRAYELSAAATKQLSAVASGFATRPPSAPGSEKVGAIKQALTPNECVACGGTVHSYCIFGFDSLCSWACLVCAYECQGGGDSCLDTGGQN